MSTNTPSSYKRGLDAEALAAQYYARDGYTVLAQRYKTRDGELDLVLKKQNVLVFVEVKYRASMAAGLEAVTPRQQKRWRNAALQYLANTGQHEADCRFDVAVVLPAGLVQPIMNVLLVD